MRKLVECVPNFSEGRRNDVIGSIVTAAEEGGALVLDAESDPDHNRTVLTFAGAPDQVLISAFATVKRAAELIDLNQHEGEHPRMGATDVVPFVPVEGVTMEDCVALARELATKVWEELEIPVYFYEAAATRPERRSLPDVRKGEFEGLREAVKGDPTRRPDVGGPLLHRTAGAVAVGARKFLIAYNVNLRTSDLAVAKAIAKKVREKDGGLPGVRALGFELKDRGCVQVSMNLVDYERTGIGAAFRAVEGHAREAGAEVLESEVVGLLPAGALTDAFSTLTRPRGFSPSQVLETRLAERARLHEIPLERFVGLVASDSPAPGGGSVAAACVAQALALGVMVGGAVARKSGGRGPHGLESLMKVALTLVEKDARAFDSVMAAYKLPRKGEEEKLARRSAIEKALHEASAVPLRTASIGVRGADDLLPLARDCDPGMISDIQTAVAVLDAGVTSALANVKVNADALGERGGSVRLLERTARKEWKSARRALENALAEREMKGAGAAVELVDLSRLRPHEEFTPEGVVVAKGRMIRDQAVSDPILVAKEEMVILNGHHRYQALRELGAARAPVLAVDYSGASVEVELYPGSRLETMSKRLVLEAGRSGRLMPPKSSRHAVRFEVPRRKFSLEELGVPEANRRRGAEV